MSIVKPAWPQAGPIVAGAAVALAVLMNAASVYFGIVFYPLILLTVTYPLATLLSLIVGLRVGGWSRLGGIRTFAIGIAAHSAGLVGYWVTISWANAVGNNGDTPPIFDLAFYGAAALFVVGYGIVLGALLRAAVLLLRRR